MLVLLLAAQVARAQVVVSLDINDRSTSLATNNLAGFDPVVIGSFGTATMVQTNPTVLTFGAVTVTLSGAGTDPGYDDRLRNTPGDTAVSQAPLYRDFIFSRDTNNGGLNITLDGLTPDQFYRVTIWSFDQGTTGGRTSDWTANGTAVKTGYFFNGSTLPTSDGQYQFNFTAAASAGGQLTIQGRRVGAIAANNFAVFLNALRVEISPPEPPVVTQQPSSLSLLTGSRAAFKVVATGTSPLAYQWRKGGDDLVDETNQTLVLNNIALSDAGGFDIVVTNIAGGTTSQVATLTVTPRPPPPAAFKVDFNDLGTNDVPANTEAGFSSFSLPEFGAGPFAHSINGAEVTLTAIGTIMESRKRTTPTNSGPFTEGKLLQDFVFTRDATTAQGLDVAVEFMEPNKPYRVGIWSFDTLSTTPARVSDWTANGVPVITGYSFAGGTLPADNNTYRFNFDSTSDGDGKILIQGRRSASATASLNVFINAIKVEKRELRVIGIEYPTPFDITLVVQIINPAAEHFLVMKASLTDPMWVDPPVVVYEGPTGGILKATFERPAGPTQFYRILQVDP